MKTPVSRCFMVPLIHSQSKKQKKAFCYLLNLALGLVDQAMSSRTAHSNSAPPSCPLRFPQSALTQEGVPKAEVLLEGFSLLLLFSIAWFKPQIDLRS